MSTPEISGILSDTARARMYWQNIGFSVRKALAIHQLTGQLTVSTEIAEQYNSLFKDPTASDDAKEKLYRQRRPWGNVTQHCLVQVPRTETLGRWIDLAEDTVMDMKTASALHDASKKDEIMQMREAMRTAVSPLTASRKQAEEFDDMLREASFSERVRRLSRATGGQPAELIEAQRLLDQPDLSDDNWAYLIVHYVDDCSVDAKWVESSRVNPDGTQVNIIDYRTEGNKAKSQYNRISEEIGAELAEHPVLGGMNNHDSMSIVSHGIEQRLAARIRERTGEIVDPFAIPERVDQKIREAIKEYIDASNSL